VRNSRYRQRTENVLRVFLAQDGVEMLPLAKAVLVLPVL
jgi:hypothetical protein